MVDLNSMRIFEHVASLLSFSAAGKALGLPKSTVSRSITRLERELGARLLQRTSHDVALTHVGEALHHQVAALLGQLNSTLDELQATSSAPRGYLNVTAPTGFGINVLVEALPRFLRSYPDVNVGLDLSSRILDLVSDNIDVAIRVGPMRDSSSVAIRLGSLRLSLCAAPGYLKRRGTPRSLPELRKHDTIGLRGLDGRARPWVFMRGGQTRKVQIEPRVYVNDAMAIHRLVAGGAGLGLVMKYLTTRDLAQGRLVALFPDWEVPSVDVHAVFPSNRELSPAVRAFVDFMKQLNMPEEAWSAETGSESAHH